MRPPRPFPRARLAALALAFLATALPASLSAAPLRVLLLGDSITAGSSPGYRGYLYRDLVNSGLQVDFIGNNSNLPSAPTGLTLDPHHQAMGGFTVGPGPSAGDSWTGGKGSVYANLDDWLSATNPNTLNSDLILITIGVNDVGNTGSRDPDYDVANEFHRRIAGLLDKILTLRPRAGILLTTVLPGGNRDQGTVFDISPFGTANPKLGPVVAARSSHVALYDGRNLQGTGLTWAPTDFPSGDVVHPNDSGYQKVAAFWGTSIRHFLQTRGLPAADYSDTTKPTITASIPAAGVTGFGATRPVFIEFSKHIVAGTGAIRLKNLDGGPDVVLDAANPAQVKTIRWELTLTPPSPLAPATRYAVQIEPTAVKDLFGNTFAGISDTTTLAFTTGSSVTSLYAEDFELGSTGWAVGQGSLTRSNGRMNVTAAGTVFAAYTGARFTGDLAYSASIIRGNAERCGLMFNTQGSTTGYAAVLTGSAVEIHKITGGTGAATWNFHLNGNTTLVSTTPFTGASSTSAAHTVRVEVNATAKTADVLVNGTRVFTGFALSGYLDGSVGFVSSFNAGSSIDNVSISRLVPAPAAPTISPASGTHNAPLYVALSSTTAGAEIRYTLDGGAPTSTTGLVYTGPFALTSSATVRAAAYQAGAPLSAVTSATLTVNPLLGSWRSHHVIAADGSQDLLSPAGDGVPNLHKYAFNLAPTFGDLLRPVSGMMAADGNSGLPRIELDPQQRLAVTFVRRKASSSPGITYTVQTSADLASWTTLPLTDATVTSIDELWERVHVRGPAADANAPRVFARVRVATP